MPGQDFIDEHPGVVVLIIALVVALLALLGGGDNYGSDYDPEPLGPNVEVGA